ncbi:MAG TPA: 50S ribosomal protein L30 [Candidatus Limnocylindrales bacterium]|nr:50S ribosomal protein L30 [Candidatus Limnocylindrales bacterium]
MAQKTEQCRCLVAVKVRGTVSALRETRETLNLLHLTHTNHAVLIDNRPAYHGMLRSVNNYVTWGEPTKETVSMMLQKRGRLAGGKKLTDEILQKAGYKSIDDLADAIVACKVAFQKLPDVQPLFKLHPPSKGYKGKTKKGYRAGGEAGYRGEAINELLKRMI